MGYNCAQLYTDNDDLDRDLDIWHSGIWTYESIKTMFMKLLLSFHPTLLMTTQTKWIKMFQANILRTGNSFIQFYMFTVLISWKYIFSFIDIILHFRSAQPFSRYLPWLWLNLVECSQLRLKLFRVVYSTIFAIATLLWYSIYQANRCIYILMNHFCIFNISACRPIMFIM